jgi:hypothetical protein
MRECKDLVDLIENMEIGKTTAMFINQDEEPIYRNEKTVPQMDENPKLETYNTSFLSD